MSVSQCIWLNCKVDVVWTKVFNYIDLNVYYGDLQFGWKIGWKKNKPQYCLMSIVVFVFFGKAVQHLVGIAIGCYSPFSDNRFEVPGILFATLQVVLPG